MYFEYIKDSQKYSKKNQNQNKTKQKTPSNPIKTLAKNRKRQFTEENIQMANKHIKRCSTLLTLGKCKLKLQWDITIIHLSVWLK